MEARAHLRHARISPRKVKIVCDLIRGKDTKTAEAILMQTPKAASSCCRSFCAVQYQTRKTITKWIPTRSISEVFATPGRL